MTLSFDRNRHVRYFTRCLSHLPDAYSKLDTNRLTLVHFAVQALDLLGVLDEALPDKKPLVEWIYRLQVQDGGFLGGTFMGETTSRCLQQDDNPDYVHGHIAMSYTALCTLTALGDDLSRVNRQGMVQHLYKLQRRVNDNDNDDGSFQCVEFGSEHDMRFLYCACAISYMLQDWSGVDINKAVSFIQKCRSFDGAIALLPGQEGHGGSTFCGVAALVLMDRLDDVLLQHGDWYNSLLQWCVSRQITGMQGRPNKDEDTCYSYWIGGTLRLLQRDELLQQAHLRNYVLACQTPMGGFGKVAGAFPDVLHSFYSMAWLSLSHHEEGEEMIELKPLNCTLGICQERANVFGSTLP